MEQILRKTASTSQYARIALIWPNIEAIISSDMKHQQRKYSDAAVGMTVSQ